MQAQLDMFASVQKGSKVKFIVVLLILTSGKNFVGDVFMNCKCGKRYLYAYIEIVLVGLKNRF